ncbi:MAG: bifunctional diaminohydroxyphosphoribosylaminopyrimidine deaminase/5-amino-6-(5-phosphoribosylamino)uracil reductase RibD [Symploca sp. SIO2E9]|nr:bifunctional diaminohydroxyphosphoribosylaminopyrimidine deaminase/5-amino-6-(5-phosphoribosylamino)uracil reductase RibD [Symploca sp. SIO2E9]
MEKSPVDAQPDYQNLSLSSPLGTPFERMMMQRCIQLARRALGLTTPNPIVGAVVVRDGKIVGEGFHPGPGQPHAEVFALREAGEQARGGTVYVNLEPCNHYGRTPPCSEALIAAGVAKVVVGMIDPNPQVSGGGIKRLTEAGIEVVVGIEEADCRELNEAFIHRILHQRPLGILKYAMTLDGKIAAASGHSQWVTGKEARAYVHQIRAACDAVIVGGNTVRHDNPYLTSHNLSTHNPLRVVMTRTLNLPLEANLWQTSEAHTLVLTETGANPYIQEQLLNMGVEVLELRSLTPRQVMTYLYERELSCVLWECGGVLGARAIAEGAVQKVLAFIAPKIIGGREALSPVEDLGLVKMTDALNLERVSCRQLGSDYLLEGYLP